MVEILLSLVLLVAAVALAIWPYALIHDHTIDGLFLTLTGSMLTLLFLFNFMWQLRFQGAKEVTAIRHAWQRLTRTASAAFSKGGTDMRTIPPRVGIPLVMGTVLLLVLAFPSSLYANDLSAAHQNPIAGHNHADRGTPESNFDRGDRAAESRPWTVTDGRGFSLASSGGLGRQSDD